MSVRPPPAEGTFVAVVGPSGAGKDSLIAYARQRMDGRVFFPRRFITRAPGDPSEHHISVSEDEYARAAERGDFALRWSAHDTHYALPRSIDAQLRGDGVVVANISRTVIALAHARFSRVVTVFVSVSIDVQRHRLQARARENTDQITARLSRTEALPTTATRLILIDNSGPI